MNKETKCALCSYRSIHNGNCLVDNQGCQFKPNGYGKIFVEELETIKLEIHKLAFDDDGEYMGVIDNDDIMDLIDNYIARLKGNNNENFTI